MNIVDQIKPEKRYLLANEEDINLNLRLKTNLNELNEFNNTRIISLSELFTKERNESNLGITAPRLLKALEIYKKNPRIIILYSSFSQINDSGGWNDYEVVKKFFFDQGVKSDNLILENSSKNTFENINNSKNIIKNYKGVWGLITSANHMPRSFYAFKKQGIILEPINVDYKTGTSKVFWINFDILSGINHWFIIFHEVLGLAYYKLTNKI